MKESIRFRVMSTAAPSAHRSGITIFYSEAEHFAIEELRLHGPNVIRFQMVKGGWWWNIVVCYIDPINDLTIEGVVAAIRDRP